MSREVARISAELGRMFDGDAWHGPAVMEALRDVDAARARERLVPHAHSIYELTHHLAAWIDEVRSRLLGAPPGSPADGDWPSADAVVSEATWNAARERLADRHRALLATLESFPDERLGELVDPRKTRAADQGVTFYVLLHGLVQHNAYHAGQIMLLRRAMEQRPPG